MVPPFSHSFLSPFVSVTKIDTSAMFLAETSHFAVAVIAPFSASHVRNEPGLMEKVASPIGGCTCLAAGPGDASPATGVAVDPGEDAGGASWLQPAALARINATRTILIFMGNRLRIV